MNATPETFKPGERWLIWHHRTGLEVICLEWSPSGKWVKYRSLVAAPDSWIWTDEKLELLERVPLPENTAERLARALKRFEDGEGGNHKTESKSRPEAPCGECACCKWVIEKQRKKIYEAIEKGGIKYEGEEGETFSVITDIEAEVARRRD